MLGLLNIILTVFGCRNFSLCKFVRIRALKGGDKENSVDLVHLEEELKNGDYKTSFFSASNVTGMKSDLKSIGSILHKYNALFFVDYAQLVTCTISNMERDNIDTRFIYLCTKKPGGSNPTEPTYGKE